MQIKPRNFLTVKNNIVVLKVFPLLEPLGVLVEDDTHCLPAAQNTKKPHPSFEMFATSAAAG